MSQRLVFESIQNFDNGATRAELQKKIEEEYPERSLSAYVHQRLTALIEKKAVFEEERNGEQIYDVNPAYSPTDLSVSLFDFDRNVTRRDLESHGIEVTNIVGNARLCDSIDLLQLGIELPDVEYEPETSPLAVWRPFDENAATVLIPSSGRITLVGIKTRNEMSQTIETVFEQLERYAEGMVEYETFEQAFQISNIATVGSLGRELDLSPLAVGLGLEDTEYDPENFPGVVYRGRAGVVILIFRSGKVVITANSYQGILKGWNNLCHDLVDIGVEIDA